MSHILAWFGYIKVPKEAIKTAIRISIMLEDDFKSLIKLMSTIRPEFAEHLKVRLKAMQTLTKFLRAGKLLG